MPGKSKWCLRLDLARFIHTSCFKAGQRGGRFWWYKSLFKDNKVFIIILYTHLQLCRTRYKVFNQISKAHYPNMPAGPDETDNHAPGAATEHVMKNSSSKTDSNASTHPLHDDGESKKGDKVQFRHHEANPGPVVPKEINAPQEGTKEERRAKAEALNK